MEKQKLLKSLKRRLGWMLCLVAFLAVGFSTQEAKADSKYTVYFAPASDWLSKNSANSIRTNYQKGSTEWGQNDMSITSLTYQGRPIYKGEAWEKYGGLDQLQFQAMNNGSVKATVTAFNGWKTSGINNYMMSNSSSGSWIAYAFDKDMIWGDFGSGWKGYPFLSGSVKITLAASTTYKFGIKNTSGYYRGNTGTMTRSSCSGWKFEDGKGDAQITTDIAGEYTFSVTSLSSDPVLSVTYPCPTPSLSSVTGDANVDTGSEHTYTATGASAGATGVTISSYDWTLPSGWTKKSSNDNTITVTVGNTTGTVSISCKVTNSCGTQSSAKSKSVTVSQACTNPTVSTTAASNVGTTTATLGGSYSGGSATPTEVGIEWTSGTTIAASSVTTPFTVSATGLTAGTTYKYKAYAKACGGNKVYGTEQTFKTTCTATKPSVSTVGATSIGTTYATIGCNVTSAGMNSDCSTPSITARGIEWTQGKSGQEPIGSGTGSLTKQITGLTPGTEYKYMAFATNANGTTYGAEQTFTTTCPKPSKPLLTCTSDNNRVLPGTKAAFTVNTESGATYQLYANSAATGSPVTGDGTAKTLTSGADMGNSAVTYYVKACSNIATCTSSCNQSDGLEVKPLTIWVRGDAVGSWDNGTQMTQNGQVFSLEFSNNDDDKEFKYLYEDNWEDYSQALYNTEFTKGTDAGVSWTYATEFDGDNRKNSNSGTISTGYEAPKTLYINPITKKVWIEAVAQSCEPPTSVTTAAASNIKSTAATLGGSYTGGSGTPTEVGIEWEGSHIQEAAKTVASTFTVDVKDLSANNEYTYRAYAKACETIVYGTTQTLTTCAVPVMAQATRNNDYGSDYLKFNVKATSLGCTVTEWGVNVYSNSGCTSLVKSVQGAGSLSTSFQVVNVTGLTSNTNYWVKSYAKYDNGDNMVEAGTATIWQPKVVLGETSSSSVTSNSATVSSSTLLGGGAKTAMTALFRYSTSAGSIASGATIASSQTQIGQTISVNLTGLTSGTTYYYRVEVTYTDSKGTVNLIGETKSFTTLGVHGDITGLPASPVAKCSGEELQLAPQCSTATSWSYSSSATGVATVSNTGLIEAVGAGSTVITVTAKADNYIDKSVQITVNVSASPAVSASTTNTTAYEVITLTSTSGSVTWSKSDAAAYFVNDNKAVDDDTVDAVSVNFKAPVKVGAYTVGATSNGCTSNLSITISTPTEVCN